MQPNMTIELTVSDLGMDLEGIGKYGEYTVFVPYALPGERVKAKIAKIKKNLVFAELKEIVEPSPLRVKPPCNRFGRCGGCDCMHLDYQEGLKYKKKNIERILSKNAGYNGPVDDFIPSEPYAYRNKVQLPFGTVNGKTAVGFYKSGTHKIVSSTKCFLHGEWLERFIRIMLDYAGKHNLTAYDEVSGKGLLRHVTARYIDDVLTATVVINGDKLPYADELADSIQKEFEDSSLYYSVNKKDTNVIMGDTVVPVKIGRTEINVDGIKVGLNPYSFFQVNDGIRRVLYERVVEELTSFRNPVVVDAYAGVGLLGALMAKKGAKIYNIEIVKEAVEDGKKLYDANGVADRVRFICGDAGKELAPLLSELKTKITDTQTFGIVIDPPRKGISRDVVNALNECAKTVDVKLVYVSCNPATLARDLKLLTAYKIERVTPYDMFALTSGAEVLCEMKSLSDKT